MTMKGDQCYNTDTFMRQSGEGKKRMRKIQGLTALLLAALLLAAAGAQAEKSVLMTFAGDCTLGGEGSVSKKEESFAAFAEKYGYDYFFANFRELFEKDDLTVVNLEGVLSDSAFMEKKGKTFRFRGPTDYVKILTGSSVEAVSLANNHIMDFSAQGAESTKRVLDENGVSWFWNETYYVFEHDGVRIAFFGLEHSKYASLGGWLNRTFRELKDSGGVSAVVVYVHTGIEYKGEHENKAALMAQDLVGMGADLVLLSHPHVLQGVDIIDNRTVFYSMGNFVFGGNSAIRYEKYHAVKEVSSLYSMAIQVKMSFTNEGQYLGQRVVVYPAYISDDPNVNHYQPRRVNAQEARPVREAIQRDTAFELPELKEEDGLALMEFPYLAATDVMLPEDDED